MPPSPSAHERGLFVFLAIALLVSTGGILSFRIGGPTTSQAAVQGGWTHAYDGGAENAPTRLAVGSTPTAASRRGEARLSVLDRVLLRRVALVVAAEEAAAPRFIANSAGDILDSSRVTIPEGKFGYLLDNPSKAGVFADSMGFDQASLDTGLRQHLVENFGNATASEPMVGGGTKFSVTGPLTGPSGAKWMITSAWGVDADGLIRLITATP